MSLVSHLVTSWAHLYSDSKWVGAIVSFFHFGGILLGGGVAVGADRLALMRSTETSAQRLLVLRNLSQAHGMVLFGVGLTVVSGLLMLAADLGTFLPSAIFWTKMAVFATLLVNGWRLRSAARRLATAPTQTRQGWRRLQRAAIASLVLWFSALALGAVLPTI